MHLLFFRVKTWALKFGIEASGNCEVATCVRKITDVSKLNLFYLILLDFHCLILPHLFIFAIKMKYATCILHSTTTCINHEVYITSGVFYNLQSNSELKLQVY